ncbi:MAG: LysM peptidoglycan-binding domain-containing protein [Clostridia bacterium]|nr:LysM peptidoglycan-binding domain-containing protein [Clostridia bacterium]
MKNNSKTQNNLKTKKRYVLKNKGRFAAIISILSVLSVLILFTSTVYSYRTPQYLSVNVKQGDTLWSLANKYGTSSDTREIVYNIKKINKLATSEIQAGSEILIPMN